MERAIEDMNKRVHALNAVSWDDAEMEALAKEHEIREKIYKTASAEGCDYPPYRSLQDHFSLKNYTYYNVIVKNPKDYYRHRYSVFLHPAFDWGKFFFS